MTEYRPFEFFQFRKVLGVAPSQQISLLAVMYILTVYGYYFAVQKTGKMDGYEPGVSILFVAFYEEFIFRGIFLKFFEQNYGMLKAIVASSFFFGIWHLKNIFWLSPEILSSQIFYTALIFGPIVAWVTLKTRSLWPAVMLHLLNNFPYQAWLQKLHVV